MTEEAKIINDILDFVNKTGYGKAIKVHGNIFTESGTPDIIGGILVGHPWRDFPTVVPFAIEVKILGEKPSKIQEHRLWEWGIMGGFAATWVTSLEEFKEFIERAMNDYAPLYDPVSKSEEKVWRP